MSLQRDVFRSAPTQLLLLALTFALPLLSGQRWFLVPESVLAEILALEFGVVVMGGLLFGLFAVPGYIVTNAYARWGIWALFVLLSLPMARSYGDEYGWLGAAMFLWLLFITFGGAFIGARTEGDRGRLMLEAGVRWLFCFVFFAGLAAAFDTPVNVERWGSRLSGLAVGTVYFSVLGIIDLRRGFTRFTLWVFALTQGRWRPLPKRFRGFDRGAVPGRVGRHARVHSWWLMLLGGLVCVAAVAGAWSAEWDNGLLPWVFITPFAIAGLALLMSALALAWALLWAPAARFEMDLDAYHGQRRVRGRGMLPRFPAPPCKQPPHVSASLRAFRIHPRPSLSDLIPVEITAEQALGEPVGVHMEDDRFKFAIEADLPESPGNGGRTVWHLVLDIEDRGEGWSTVFALPAPPERGR